MTALRQRMIEDLQLRGLSEGTQIAYVRVVRQLAEYYDKSPDRISEEEVRQYFLYLKNDKQIAPGTFGAARAGIKFLFVHTLGREWRTLDLIRPPRERKLPVVLSVAEVRKILELVRSPRFRVCLNTIYACGLRISEGVSLQVRAIDSERMVVQVRHGKGNKDRYVPLPQCILEMLREFWCTVAPHLTVVTCTTARPGLLWPWKAGHAALAASIAAVAHETIAVLQPSSNGR
jgi:integrase/recombinase XerD